MISDPNITLSAIQSHSAALEGAIRRHSANAARCKVWSVGIVAGVVVLAAGRAQMAALPWAAAPVVLLALADACQVVMARICTDAYNAFMRKLPLNGGDAMKAEECFVQPAPDPGWRQMGQVLGALGSLSVLPFYGALLALVVAFHVQTSPSDVKPAQPMNGTFPPAKLTPATTNTRSAPTAQGSQSVPGFSPPKLAQPQTGVRPPTGTPARFPSNTAPVQKPVQTIPSRPTTTIPGAAAPGVPNPARAPSAIPGSANSAPPSPVTPGADSNPAVPSSAVPPSAR
jgi:hypothetical protein